MKNECRGSRLPAEKCVALHAQRVLCPVCGESIALTPKTRLVRPHMVPTRRVHTLRMFQRAQYSREYEL